MRLSLYLVSAALTGCIWRPLQLPAKPEPAAAPEEYIDLRDGWRVRVVTPILKSGGYRFQTDVQEVAGNTITISAGTDFIGYETAYYAVRARSEGGVAIEFGSAEVTKEGKTTPQARPVASLFELPESAKYVRLLYVLRISHADHDMAVVATDKPETLDAFTRDVQAKPADACKVERGTFCAWIPAGIAVRPEAREIVRGVEEWNPVR